VKNFYIFLFLALFSANSFTQSKFGIGLNAEAAMPMDLFADLVSTGFGGNVYGSYSLNENWDITLSAGYINWAYDIDGAPDNFPDMNFTIIPIMAGAKYYFIQGNVKPYAALDLGLHIATAEGAIYEDDLVTYSTETKTETKGGWGIGIGCISGLSETVSLDISAKLKGNGLEVIKGDEDSGNYEKASVIFFSINAGVKISL
jgi:hypothetical protein